MSNLKHYDKAVFEVLLSEAQRKARDFNAQNIANTLLAIAIAHAYNDGSIQSMLARLSCLGHDLDEIGFSQIYMFALGVSIEQPNLECKVPAEVLAAAKQVWSRSVQAARSSKLHLQVSETLTKLKVSHENEVEVGGFSCDIVIQSDPVMVVEVDGPSHFFRNLPREPLGTTVFKARLLAAQGTALFSVPYFDWGAQKNSADRQEYLRHLIGTTQL